MPHPALRFLLPFVLVACGVAGFVHLHVTPAPPPAGVSDDAAASWFLQHEGDETPHFGRPPGSEHGVLLAPGTTLRLLEEDYELQRYATLNVVLQLAPPAGERAANTRVELVLRETPQASVVLALQLGEPCVATATLLRPGAAPQPLGRGECVAPGPAAGRPFQLGVKFDGPRFVASLDGERLLGFAAQGLQHGNLSLRVASGDVRVRRLQARGQQTSQHGVMRNFTLSESLIDPPPPPRGPAVREALLLSGAAALLAALFLHALCRGRPGAGDLLCATLVWLCGPALPLALSLLRPVPALPVVCGVLALLTLPLALATLRPAVHEPVPAGRLRTALALVPALLLGGAAALLCARQADAALAPVIAREAAAQRTPLPPPWTVASASLHAANALESPAAWRDLDLRATVRLSPDGALGVRVRAPDPQLARGVLLTLSADARLASGFRLEDFKRFEPLDERRAALPAGEALALELRVRGGSFSALLDGEPLAHAEDTSFAAGRIHLLALRGTVQLDGLRVTAVPAEAPLPSLLRARLAGAWLPLAVLLYALVAARLLGHRLLPVLHACAFALVPVACGFLLVPAHEFSAGTLTWMGGGAAVVLAIVALVHGPRARRPAAVTAALLLLAGGVWAAALPLAVERRALVESTDLNRLGFVDWSGERLHDGLLYLEHPLLRRWNDYLARHRFREREARIERTPGTARIVTLGGSSTWGYRIPPASGADWPAQLEALLARDRPVEVINAAFVGATSDRLLHFFKDAVLPFAPDILVLCVTFNDFASQSLGEEARYLETVTAPDYSRSLVDDLLARKTRDRERRALEAVVAALPRDPRSTTELWRLAGMTSSPPARFEAVLRRFAALCRTHGIRLVLVKEPLAPGQRLAWKEEFDAAIDAVAADTGALSVDCSAAIRASGGRDLFMDRVHPKPSGCAVIARELATVLQPLLPAR